MDAARHMVGGDIEETGFEIDEGILDDLKVLGAPDEMLEAWERQMVEQGDFELFEDNALSATVFEAMCTQWRYRGEDGLPVGLDYSSLPVVERRVRRPDGGFGIRASERGPLFEDLRIMEIEAIKVFGERRA